MFIPDDVQRLLTAQTAEERKQARYDIMFRDRSYQTSGSLDLNPFDLAYRADTKQEYYWDVAEGLVEFGLIYLTGGAGRIARSAIGVVEQLTADN